jgi:alpha-2-macroglobulin
VLPDNLNLGTSTVTISDSSSTTYHTFKSEEFRKPEFKVSSSKLTSSAAYVSKSHAIVKTSAAYYAGGNLSGAKANHTVTVTESSYTPPTNDLYGYRFGKYVPYWYNWWSGSSTSTNMKSKSLSGETDINGEHHVKIDFKKSELNPPKPLSCTTSTYIIDKNNQTLRN